MNVTIVFLNSLKFQLKDKKYSNGMQFLSDYWKKWNLSKILFFHSHFLVQNNTFFMVRWMMLGRPEKVKMMTIFHHFYDKKSLEKINVLHIFVSYQHGGFSE